MVEETYAEFEPAQSTDGACSLELTRDERETLRFALEVAMARAISEDDIKESNKFSDIHSRLDRGVQNE